MKSLEITFSGNPQVLGNLLKKKELLAKNDPEHKTIKTILLLPGGGQEGVIEGGVAVALEKLNLIDSFDYVMGISTGAAIGYYTLAKEAAIGTTIYFDDNIKDHFVNFLRLWKIMDIDGLEKRFRGVKPINLDRFRASRPTFLVGITDKETGLGNFVDAKSFTDPLTCIIPSICVPVVDGGRSVALNGRLYVDGALSNPLPITYVLENLNPTDILIALPEPLNPKRESIYKLTAFWAKIFPRLLNKKLSSLFTTFVDRYNRELEYLTGEKKLPDGVRVGVIHPTHTPINAFTMNKKLLEEGALSAMEFTENLFQNGQSEVKKI